jgi:cbb3-type cytochrome oxidase cytochrome c subunit
MGMGHNPPRPPSLSLGAMARIHEEIETTRRAHRPWDDLDDLARMMRNRAMAGRNVVLKEGDENCDCQLCSFQIDTKVYARYSCVQ